jgi:tripartite-type tricarboxylate transporter receptor subunit TctC
MMKKLIAFGGAALLALGTAAQQPTWPTKQVRIVVAFSPGGSTDVTARILQAALSERWKQPVVIENKPGADGNIAAEQVARAPADGSVFLFTVNSLTITPALGKLSFDPLKDLKPVAQVLSIPNLLVVHPSLTAKSVSELVALAKEKPLAFASAGTGTAPFIGMALLMQMTGARMTHVPFKGSAPAVTSTLGNHTQLMFGDVNSTLPHVRAGKLRALGVSSLQRSPLAPEIPTLAESGVPGFDTATWNGLFAPAGTPAHVIEAAQRDVLAVLADPAIVAKVREMGGQVQAIGSAALAEKMRKEIEEYTRVARELNIKSND